MDDILNEQYERVDRALTTLVDSIAAYNPNTQVAIDLLAADDELSARLDQLAQHQANHVRIERMRAEADALEDQQRTHVKKLAELRHELFETPATTFPEDSRAVPFDELLQYATNISTYTVPPTYRERVPTTDKDKEEDEAASSGAPTNGVNTPANAIEAAEPSKDGAENQKEAENVDRVPEITAEEEEWLQKLKASNLAWYPWPSNEKIRAGILYSLQYWREKGKDLDEFNIPAHLEAERLRLSGEKEGSGESPVQAVQQHHEWVQHRQRAQGVFEGFEDMDED